MDKLYPLVFNPIFKEKIWGGEKIKTILGKDFSPQTNCGETWELSGVEGNISTVRDGHLKGKLLTDLIKEYKETLVGNKVYELYKDEFPLLIKFIDAREDLSIQVHPNDRLAKERHNSFGKTEMWYVVQADEGASLISGFNQELTKDEYLKNFNNGTLTNILNREEVQTGDVFFIPAGRVHTIGQGLLIAEIQQTSDITYRIYDFDRVDANGNKRALHVEEALDAIDYTRYDEYKTSTKQTKNQPELIVESNYFSTEQLIIDNPIKVELDGQSFKILVFTEGKCELIHENNTYKFSMGDVVLLPSNLGSVKINPNASTKFLITYIPQN